MKTCVLIPSYNEESTIGNIVRKIRSINLDVIVVDDGSGDSTGKIASENGALVIRHTKNMGKGASLKEGFDLILRTTTFDAVIIMDGDGQHSTSDIQKFIKHAEEYGDDIIVGNRMEYVKNMPPLRLLTNRLTSFFLSFMCKQRIPDTQCGFRLIRRSVIEKLNLMTNKYDLESEILIKASKEKFKITSIPIETIYQNESSNIHPVKDSFRFIVLIIRSYIGR